MDKLKINIKDRNNNNIDIGDVVSCNGLEFKIEEFKVMPNGLDEDDVLACGDYGCINVSLIEKVDTGQ